MCFVAMLECSNLLFLMHLDGLVLLIADRWHICFACHLQTVHPIPVIFISISTEINSSFQWHSWFSKLRPGSIFPFWNMHMHCISHPAYHAMFCIMLFVHCTWLIVSPFACVFAWVEPRDEYVIEEPVEYVYEDQANVNLENFAGKMTIPSKSLLSLLARCSLFCCAYATIPTTCLLCLPYFHVKPLTHLFLAHRCLAMLPLCSAPLIALLVAGKDWR